MAGRSGRTPRRGERGWRVGRAALAYAMAFLAPIAAAERVVQVRGSVTDETGAPVPGDVVRLLKSRSILDLSGLKSRDQNVEETRTTTDAHGLFEFDFPVDSKFRTYYLRFYDPQGFDAVKYRLPEDQEITRHVRHGQPVQTIVVLKTQRDWPQVKALIDQYGAASHCGQILRSLGMPTRRTPQGEGRELWEYDAAGVAYLIEGSKVLETRRVGKTAPAEAAGAPGDRPEPATRVEGP